MGGNHGRVGRAGSLRARRWVATVPAVVAVSVVLASCASAPAATAPVGAAQVTTASGSEAGKALEAQKNLETLFDSFKISGGTFEEVATSYVDLNSKWLNTGLNVGPDFAALGYGAEGMVPVVEAKYDEKITSNLYTESGPAQAVVSDYETNLRKDVIQEYWISWSRGDKNPYVHKIEATSVKLVSSDNPDFDKATSFTVRVTTHVTDNGNLNVAQNRIEHGVAAQIDITRTDLMSFVRESTNAPYKLDAKSLQKITDNSK